MDALAVQIRVVSEELGTLRNELIQAKTSHANLHQSVVEANTASGRRIEQVEAKLQQVARDAEGVVEGKPAMKKALIEPKNVEVKEFAGGLTDGRSKFLMHMTVYVNVIHNYT